MQLVVFTISSKVKNHWFIYYVLIYLVLFMIICNIKSILFIYKLLVWNPITGSRVGEVRCPATSNTPTPQTMEMHISQQFRERKPSCNDREPAHTHLAFCLAKCNPKGKQPNLRLRASANYVRSRAYVKIRMLSVARNSACTDAFVFFHERNVPSSLDKCIS